MMKIILLHVAIVSMLSYVQSASKIKLPEDCPTMKRKKVFSDSEYTINWNGGRFLEPCKIYFDNHEKFNEICFKPESYYVKNCELEMTFSLPPSSSNSSSDDSYDKPALLKRRRNKNNNNNYDYNENGDDDDSDRYSYSSSSNSNSGSSLTKPITYTCNEDPREYCGRMGDSLYIEIAATSQVSAGDSFTLKVYSSKETFNTFIGLFFGVFVPLAIAAFIGGFFFWRRYRRKHEEPDTFMDYLAWWRKCWKSK